MGQRRKHREIRKYLEMNENKNTTLQKLLDTAKVVLRTKSIVVNTYIKKEERSQINNPIFHHEKL